MRTFGVVLNPPAFNNVPGMIEGLEDAGNTAAQPLHANAIPTRSGTESRAERRSELSVSTSDVACITGGSFVNALGSRDLDSNFS